MLRHFAGRRLYAALIPAVAAAMLACEPGTNPQEPNPGPNPNPPPSAAVASVVVSPKPLTLVEGSFTTLAAVTKDANGGTLEGRAIVWGTTDADVVTVSAQGVVVARATGTAYVHATSEGKSDTASVTVYTATPTPGPVASLELDAATATLAEGQSRTFTATARDAGGIAIEDAAVQWTSGDPTVATVSPAGAVEAVRNGTATITAAAHGRTASVAITVTADFAFDMLFSAYDNGALEIFVSDIRQPSPTRARVLPAGTWAGEARPSPDGTRIAFLTTIDDVQGIYVMNRDGSNVTLLANRVLGPVLRPTWSPDGTKIAYQTGGGVSTSTMYDIWVMSSVDGSGKMNLTADLGFTDQMTPSWSPEYSPGASRIAFVHRANNTERVWTMRPDGTDKREITKGQLDWQPSWSPDGTKIVFTRTNVVNNGEIHVVYANGTNERPVMDLMFGGLAGPQFNPVFTPDGRMIAFGSVHETWGQGGEPQEIYTVWLDGTKLARRTTAGGMWPAFISRP